MPGVVFRFDRPKESRCCICGRGVREAGVDLFVFWPGEEDPVPAAAHERCLEERTLVARPGDTEAARSPARRAPRSDR
jgi:hypothetical protein